MTSNAKDVTCTNLSSLSNATRLMVERAQPVSTFALKVDDLDYHDILTLPNPNPNPNCSIPVLTLTLLNPNPALQQLEDEIQRRQSGEAGLSESSSVLPAVVMAGALGFVVGTMFQGLSKHIANRR